jgi:hypothetical protein
MTGAPARPAARRLAARATGRRRLSDRAAPSPFSTPAGWPPATAGRQPLPAAPGAPHCAGAGQRAGARAPHLRRSARGHRRGPGGGAGHGQPGGRAQFEWLALVSVLYAVQAITLWLLPRFGGLTRAEPDGRRDGGSGCPPSAWTCWPSRCCTCWSRRHLQLRRPAGAAGADGGRADGAPASRWAPRRRGADAAGGGLAHAAGRRRAALMLQSGLAGWAVHHHAAGRRTGRPPGARGTGRARQPGAGAPAGAAEPPGDRGDGRRRAGRRPPPARARRQPGGARPAGQPGPEPAGALHAAAMQPAWAALQQAVSGAGRRRLARSRAAT